MDKIIAFDVWGDYAHFRKYYTTTSPLSFSFPPRTTIAGLISAIIGIDKKEYLNYFSKETAKIGLKIINPIKKVRIAQNLIDTKKAIMMSRIKTRTQIRFEFLKDSKYRIYFYHEDEFIYQKAKNYLQNHKCTYTPCFGLSENIANFEYSGEFGIEKKENTDFVQIDSVIPTKEIEKVDFETNREYFTERMPTEMNNERIVTEYGEIMFERNGGKIKAKINHFWELENNERILFL